MARSHQTHFVKIHPSQSSSLNNEHDKASRSELARRIASLGKGRFVDHDILGDQQTSGGPTDTLFIPTGTIDLSTAKELGIWTESQIYGGVVPFPFVGSKVITHPAFRDDPAIPAGWCPELGSALAPHVLSGWSAFTLDTVRAAALDMLGRTAIRLKEVEATAGLGQFVVTSVKELNEAMAQLDEAAIARHGVVIEENLDDVVTYSVGTTRLFGEAISY